VAKLDSLEGGRRKDDDVMARRDTRITGTCGPRTFIRSKERGRGVNDKAIPMSLPRG
jgi:hypothetical protein